MSVNPAQIKSFADFVAVIVAASQRVTTANAQVLADAIDHDLQTEELDPIGDMSVDEVVGLVNTIAQENISKSDKPAPIDRSVMAKAIEDDLIQRTAAALSAKVPGKTQEQVSASIAGGLRAGGHGSFDTQHISATITDIVDAAKRQDPSLPDLDDQTRTGIVDDVVDDVRRETAVTLANEMVPGSAAKIPGGYSK